MSDYRLWVGRRKEPLMLCPDITTKKINSDSNGLKKMNWKICLTLYWLACYVWHVKSKFLFLFKKELPKKKIPMSVATMIR